jgi:hypothetical protein
MYMRAFTSELLSKSDTALVHEARVPSGRCREARWKDANAIRPSEASWSVCVAYASEVETWDSPDLTNTGRARLSVSTRNNSDFLVCRQL